MMIPCKVGLKYSNNIWSQSHPDGWGYKIWCLESNGYILDINIYRGTKLSGTAETPSEALLKLTEAYQGMNHLIFMNIIYLVPLATSQHC